MADRKGPGYGTPNWEMLGRWMELPAEDDGPFWALNLMKYREVADYGEGADSDAGMSGREADDAYAPLGPLKAIGAMVAFHGDVTTQPLGDPTWDRVGIVRYPSRAAFFAMQQREDFKVKHVHKEAGMATTIVMSCLPTTSSAVDGSGALVLTVERRGSRSVPAADAPGVTPVASLAVEGVIVGDERAWDAARFERAEDVDAVIAAAADAEEAFVLVLDPLIDRLVESIEAAP
jgi:hypothetical protein